MTETATDPTMAANQPSLTLVRILKAPREQVFDALTNPAALAQWWGPEGCACPDPKVDLRIGGAYQLDILESDGTLNKLTGRYLAIEPPARLRFTWTWTEGAYAGVETVVSIALKPHRNGTELTLRHTGFTTPAMVDDHNGGWSSCLDCLDTHLQQGN